MKLFLIVFIFLTGLGTQAQDAGGTPPAPAAAPAAAVTDAPVSPEAPSLPAKPLGRIRGEFNPPNDSSSFIGDPDNLDPLHVNRDNLKEDAEPVLEDIKGVLDAPKKKKKTAAPVPEVKNRAAEDSAAPLSPPPPVTMETPAPQEPVKEAKPALSADDPDLILERKFNEIFKRYNINPTPDDVWAAASSKQTARLYEVQKGDTLWSISKILFGDANFWPKLWSLNKQGILNPHFINPKMKIYFYEGDVENAPTLTVGENAKVEEEKNEPVSGASADSSKDMGKTAVYVAPGKTAPAVEKPHEQAPVTISKRSKTRHAADLPPSLPVSRNEDYYVGKQKFKQKLVIDLGTPPPVIINPNNDLVVSDEPAQTDVKVGIKEVSKYRCNDGRLLKDIQFVGEMAPEYDIYERMNDLKTTTGTKFVYRLNGRAVPYQNKYLKAVKCRMLIATDMVIVPTGRLKEINTRKISETPEAVLIGGPDVSEQRLFEKLHYGFVDFGAANFSPGQEYRTISQLTDKVNSEFTVVEKYGSYAAVFFTEVADVIEVGDKVVNK